MKCKWRAAAIHKAPASILGRFLRAGLELGVWPGEWEERRSCQRLGSQAESRRGGTGVRAALQRHWRGAERAIVDV